MIKKFSIIKRSYFWLALGGTLLVAAWAVFFSQMRFSEEFTGGVKISIAGSADQVKLKQDVEKYLIANNYKNSIVSVEKGATLDLSIKTKVETDEKVNTLSTQIKTMLLDGKYITSPADIVSQSITGPSVGDYMQKSAKNALVVGLLLMAVYMMFSFAGIRKVISPAVLAGVTIATMIFDVSIPAGAYGLLMYFNSTVNIDTVFIIAVLTNMGYSINDTIIIFDRIRENLQRSNGKNTVYGNVFDASLRETMRRSFGTVMAMLVVIIAMFVLGSGAVKDFAFTIGIGVLAGSYSSIFIAAPLAYLLMGKFKTEKKMITNHD
ncbi:MAG: protein translocase subunit SecF [Candidatus Absconditabacteria bacterium]